MTAMKAKGKKLYFSRIKGEKKIKNIDDNIHATLGCAK